MEQPVRNKTVMLHRSHLVTKTAHPRTKRILRNLERVIPRTSLARMFTRDDRTKTHLFPAHDPHVFRGSCTSSCRVDGALLVLARVLFFWLMPGYVVFEDKWGESQVVREVGGPGREAEERDRVGRRSS